MNPFLVIGGIAALLLWSKNAKGTASAPSVGTPAPSPANPSGLDAPLGPSPSGVPEIRETTPEPIASPANPSGLDAPIGPSPSGVPEIRETTTETATEVVAAEPEIVVVNDPNWTPSPEAPQEVVTISTPTQSTSQTTPLTLSDMSSSYFQGEKAQAFEQLLLQTGFYNPQAGIGNLTHTSNFWYWIRFDVLPDYSSAAALGMAQGPYYRFLLRKLDEDKNLLNSTGIEQFKAHMEQKKAALEANNNNPVTQAYPAIKDGLVHRGNGVYSPPANASDCPAGSIYLANNPYFQGYFGCVSQSRYEEIVKEKLPQINPMPASVWQDVIQLRYAGNFTDPKVLTMPASELVVAIKSRAEGCSNTWCKLVKELFMTDTTIFANDRFTFKDVVWATMDANYIAFYPVPVKANGVPRTAAPVYAMFSVSKSDYDAYKEFYDISKK
jgi:hypothetical protein